MQGSDSIQTFVLFTLRCDNGSRVNPNIQSSCPTHSSPETCLSYLTHHSDRINQRYRYAIEYWDYHTIKVEHEPAAEKAIFTVLEKLHRQRRDYVLKQFEKGMEGASILHFLAHCGLAELCKILLNKDIV